jgi:hypothetical protein
MGELDDLLSVYGRIDDAVVEDPDLQPKVAAMLPPYRQGARGWYRAYQDWQRAQGSVQLAQGRDVATALDNLQNPEESAPAPPDQDDAPGWANRHWLNGRRMLASATLGRIQNSIDLPTDADPQALLSGIATGTTGGTGGGVLELHRHLRRTAEYPSVESWPPMMADARDRGLVVDQYRNSTYVPPISWEPGSFRVVSSASGTSVALRTYYHATDLDLDEAKQCLNPGDWQRYQPPWCRMTKLADIGPNIWRYLEVVSTNCDANVGLTTVLDFRYRDVPDGGAILEYRIPDGPPLPESDHLVSIDEGSLEVRPSPAGVGGISFVTTKRIQFAAMRNVPPMPAAVLGFLVWVLGWDTLAERFIYFLARQNPPNLVLKDQPQTAGGIGVPLGAPGSGGLATLLNLGLSGWENYLRSSVGSFRTSVERAAAGNYGVADYLRDLAKLSNEVTSNATAAASLAVQLYRAASDSSNPKRPGGSDSGAAVKPPPATPGPGAVGG